MEEWGDEFGAVAGDERNPDDAVPGIVMLPADFGGRGGIRVLDASRLPPGAAVSSRRSCPGVFPVLLRVVTSNSSVRLSASHEFEPLPPTPREIWPIIPRPGHTHSRPAPVASEK